MLSVSDVMPTRESPPNRYSHWSGVELCRICRIALSIPKSFSLCQYPGEVICRTRNMASQESPLSILDTVPMAGNRRRHVRHKVHSPAYASFDGIAGGMVLDLTEVLNLCEGGMAIQAN